MHRIPGLRASIRALAAAAVALAALAAAPASAQLVQIGNGSDPVPPSICPGDTTPVQVNSFTLSHPTSAIVAGVRLKFTSADAVTLVSQIQVRQGGTILGTVVPTASGANVTFATRMTVGPTLVPLTIWAVPRAAGDMPALGSGLSFGIYVDSTISNYSSAATADTSPLASLDTVPDADVSFSGLSVAGTTVGLTWSATRDVLVLRTVGGPVTDRPANGTTYGTTGTLGSSTIVNSGLLASVSDAGRTAAKPYYYRVFTKDVCRNWSAGVPVGPVYVGAHTEGDATLGSLSPVVGILNPVGGVVTPPFRVQARVFTPSPRTIASVSLEIDDGVNTPTTQPLYVNANYGGTTSSGVYEVGPFVGGDSPGLTLAPGKYTIRVRVTDNAAGATWSAPVGLVVNAGKGDGNLLVRDNSSQLCSDCHALPTHSSEATGTKYGSWFAGCRACHAPHGTTNASLVANQITPPAVRGQLPPTRTAFSTRTGFDPAAGTTSTATLTAATYANGDRTGPCQVCHTATDHYRRNGTEPVAHYSGQCTVCHAHTGGFGVTGGCTTCHGSATSHPGYASEAPPQDTCGNTAPGAGGNNRVGAHGKHLTGSASVSNGVACNECHTDPPTRAGHPGAVCSTDPAQRAQMTWGSIATGSLDLWSGAVTPTWDVATQSCTNYCHGNFRNGSNATVTWNSTVACGSCHGLPPAGTHPVTTSACSLCHGAGYETAGISGAALATHVDGHKDGGGSNCFGCHGQDRALATGVETTLDRYKAAPPNQAAIPGVTNPTTQAHLSHTYSGTVRLPLTCDNCHPLTTSLSHSNGALDMSWGALSRVGGVIPNYSGSPTFSCATTYCHGAAFPADTRGSATVPAWTSTDGSFKDCAACHGSPPANAKHTSIWSRGAATSVQCNVCHSTTVTSTGAIDLAGGRHIDGVYDTLNVTCASCHGNPPTTAAGLANAANTNGVGAHAQHAVAPLQTRTAAFACVACHPNNTSNTHADGTPTMTFAGGLGPTTSWNDTGSGCTTSYCHGDTTTTAPLYKAGVATGQSSVAQGSWGGLAKQPVWTTTNGTYRACTACHNAPPSLPHPTSTTCADCHPAGASQTAMTGSAAGTHVDGHVDVSRTGCTACHGDYGTDLVASGDVKAAPGYYNGTAVTGRDVAGLTTGGTKIGGHRAHLQQTDLRNHVVRCDECHAIPADGNTAHANGVAAVDMAAATSTTAQVGGLSPSYLSGNCSSVYCHGAGYTARGANYVGSNTTLSWTDGTAARACGACHQVAPNTTVHASANNTTTPQNCNACHGAGYNCLKTNLAACTVDPALHINGVGNYPTGCADCHGQPPATGAHVAHVNQTDLRSTALDCDNCHGTKPVAGNVSHADGIKAIGWSVLATANATAASPTAANPPGFTTPVSCSNYCHTPGNAAVYGGSMRSPAWSAGAAARDCGACHGSPPPVTADAAVNHPQNTNCAACHGAGYATTGLTGGALGTHIDTTLQKPANGCTACHGALAGVSGPAVTSVGLTVAPGYNGAGTDSHGGTTTNDSGIGAHDAHIRKTNLRNASLTCTDCHNGRVPASGDVAHADDLLGMGWSQLATTGAVSPQYTRGAGCSATYCHGNFKNGNDQIQVVIPGQVAGVTFSSVGFNSLTLSWTAVGGATFYRVERAPDSAGTPGTFAQVGIVTGTTFDDGGLAASTIYWYRVSGASAGGNGTASPSASVRTAGGMIATEFDMVGEIAATNLGTDGNTNVLTGTTALTPTNGTVFTNKNVTTPGNVYTDSTQRRDGPAATMTVQQYNFIDMYSPPLDANNRTVGAGVSVSLDMYMRAVGTANGTWTAQLFEYTSGGVSTQIGSNCTVTYTSTSTTTLQTRTCTFNNTQWTAALNSRLKVRLFINATATTWGRPALLWGANRVTTGTLAGQTFFTATIGTPVTAPAIPTGAPANLAFSAVTQSEVTLTWDPVASTSTYKVERSPNGTNSWVQVAQSATRSFTDRGLTASTPYFYRVKASNPGGDSTTYSAIVNPVTLAPPPPRTVSWTGTFLTGSTTLDCQSCHGNPPGYPHPTSTTCSKCHFNYGDKPASGPQAVDGARHINGVLDIDANCIDCHGDPGGMGSRREVVSEFNNTWSHLSSRAGKTPTKWDCVVCHMEGSPATGDRSAKHGDGVINLRDPDTGNEIEAVTFGGANAGAYTSTPGSTQPFTQYGRNLGVALENDSAVNIALNQAMMFNFCLKCHDSNGAAAFGTTGSLYSTALRTSGGTRTPGQPFATTIPGTGYNAGAQNGGSSNTACATGTNGCVANVKDSFLTTNSSYHPILGRNNNWYARASRMATPWNLAKVNTTTANNTEWGLLMSCWDCHADPADSGLITKTVTAHGGANTVRGTTRPPTPTSLPAATTNDTTLCKVCHAGYQTGTTSHGTGSALSGNTNNGMSTFLSYGCAMCHSSSYPTDPGRPIRAKDAHGVNIVETAGTSLGRWATAGAKPYAFIRNTQNIAEQTPASIAGTAYSPICNMYGTGVGTQDCNQGQQSYTVGGTY